MGWSIEVGEGTTQLVVDAHAKFNLSIVKDVDDKGLVRAVDWIVDIEGSVVNSPASTVADDYVELTDEVATKFDRVRVVLKLDGTEKFVFDPSTGFFGPHVTDFASVDNDGSADSHWGYRMRIIFRAKGDAQTENIQALAASLATTTNKDRVVRRVWKVDVKSVSGDAAEALAITFKPAHPDVDGEVEQFPLELRATGIWQWVALQRTDEEMTTTGGNRDFVADPQVGLEAGAPKDARLHLMMREPLVVTIRGRRYGYDPNLSPPAPHYAQSATLVRATAREATRQMRIADAAQGLYVLEYEEVWLSVGPTPPPNHGGQAHNVIEFDPVPPEGKIGRL